MPFYTLKELQDSDIPVEDIFNGPKLKNEAAEAACKAIDYVGDIFNALKLNNGFIKTNELEAAQLKKVLRTSDIINRLMDIDGVLAVNNLLLSKYDAEGNVMRGAADPTRGNGKPVFKTQPNQCIMGPLRQRLAPDPACITTDRVSYSTKTVCLLCPASTKSMIP